jgi:hypothetical protein
MRRSDFARGGRRRDRLPHSSRRTPPPDGVSNFTNGRFAFGS